MEGCNDTIWGVEDDVLTQEEEALRTIEQALSSLSSGGGAETQGEASQGSERAGEALAAYRLMREVVGLWRRLLEGEQVHEDFHSKIDAIHFCLPVEKHILKNGSLTWCNKNWKSIWEVVSHPETDEGLCPDCWSSFTYFEKVSQAMKTIPNPQLKVEYESTHPFSGLRWRLKYGI